MAWVTGYRRVPDPPARMIPLYLVLLAAAISDFYPDCDSRSVVRFNPLPIASAGHVAHPLFMFQIPPHRLANSRLESLLGTPAEFALNFTCVHGVTAVVPRAIFDKRYQVAAHGSAGARHLIHNVAD